MVRRQEHDRKRARAVAQTAIDHALFFTGLSVTHLNKALEMLDEQETERNRLSIPQFESVIETLEKALDKTRAALGVVKGIP